MLRKILKYDLNSIWRVWTVCSITVLVLSIFGGISLAELIKLEDNLDNISIIRGIGAYLGIMIYGSAVSIYAAITHFLCTFRFYRNFFTDEAYLTFTLPVKRSTLLNAKLLNSFIWTAATNLITILSLAIVFAIAPAPELYGDGSMLTVILRSVFDFFAEIAAFTAADQFTWWMLIFLYYIASILASFFPPLLLYACVTFGCTLVKKHKLLMSILVYYLTNIVLSGIAYVVYVVGLMCAIIVGVFNTVLFTEAVVMPLLYLVPAAAIMFLVVLCVSTYAFILHRIEKKLNLA